MDINSLLPSSPPTHFPEGSFDEAHDTARGNYDVGEKVPSPDVRVLSIIIYVHEAPMDRLTFKQPLTFNSTSALLPLPPAYP